MLTSTCKNCGVPRIGQKEFLARRDLLRSDWANGGEIARRLTAEQMWALYDFYLVTEDSLELEILARHRALCEVQPELAHAADLAYRSFARLHMHANRAVEAKAETTTAAVAVPARRGRGGRLVAFTRPDQKVDTKRLAEALLAYAGEQAEHHREDSPEDRN